MRAALFAALLACPGFAANASAFSAPLANGPLALLVDSFGEPGVETLAARGIIVLHGKGPGRRLAAVHWKAFGALTRASSSCLALVAAADALGHEKEPAASSLNLAACRALPSDGLMTPSLHALAAALEAGHEERWALKLASAPPSGTPGRPNFFDTSWGKDLTARRHADALENPDALAKTVFDELLSGPRPEKDASALFVAAASARGAASFEALLARDAARGTLSEELHAQLRRALADERRRWAVARARAAAADLLGKASVKREFEDLRGAAAALSSRPNIFEALEAAASRAASSSSKIRFRSAGLHLQDPTRLGQHELGDEAIVSGAYWVDGLDENATVEVEETIAFETERGFSSVETRARKRRNGGPYSFSRAIKISETRSFAVRSLVSAAGSAVVSERVEVPIARDFELALIKESEAAGLRASCRLKDAEAAYSALETLIAEPAKIKPQYKSLAARARKARETVASEREIAAKLEKAVAEARADSDPKLCRYETVRADSALKLAARLPPGCDRGLPELHALRATIKRRAADQNWFLEASSEARSKRKSCALVAARARMSQALASLDADPAARCGRVAEEEARAKSDFADLARAISWRAELGKSIAKAEAEASPERRLEVLRPVSARLGALNEDCFSAESRRVAALSAAASKTFPAPAEDETARRLPSDGALVSVVAELRKERARRVEAAGAAEKAAVETPAPKPDSKKPGKNPR